jgi:hypothetical protein
MNVVKFKKISKFFFWWFGLSSLYAMFSVCPFCGRQGCPVGAGTAGLVGGFFTLLLQNWRNFVKKLKINLTNARAKILKRKC